MEKILNIKEFAELAGVSTATVSRVFSDDPKVRPQTKERIQALAEQHHFRINQLAKGLLEGKTRMIGVLLHRLTTSFFADVAMGIQEVLYPAGYLPVIASLPRESSMEAMRRLIDYRVDGLIAAVAEHEFTQTELKDLMRFRLPVVTFDGNFDWHGCDNVVSDDPKCGRLAADAFIKAGIRKFGAVYQTRGGKVHLRIKAFQERLRECGFDDVSLTERASSDFLQKLGRGVGVYCFNDFDAEGIYESASEVGWKIPEDVSVIGTADLNFAGMLNPPLTTIRQDAVAIGRRTAELVLERLRNPELSPRSVVMDVEMIERKSIK